MDEYYAEVLPEEKAGFVEREKALGHKVIMIGDGSMIPPPCPPPMLASLSVMVRSLQGEIADITIAAADLGELVVLKRLANGMLKRIGKNYQLSSGSTQG